LTWYLEFLVRFGFHGAPLSMAMPDVAVMVAFILLCPVVAGPILSYRLRNPATGGEL
jgi:hypothetical protein